MNEHFFLNIGAQTVEGQAVIPTVYEAAKSNSEAMGQIVTPDVVMTPPPEPASPGATPTPPSVPNTPGGGY